MYKLVVLIAYHFFANFMLFICQEWLKPYAAFCFLRDFFETSDHSQWGTFSQFSKNKVINWTLFYIKFIFCWSS